MIDFSGVTFDALWLLPLAVVLPVLALAVLRYAYQQRKQRLERFGTLSVVSRLIPPNTLVAPGFPDPWVRGSGNPIILQMIMALESDPNK